MAEPNKSEPKSFFGAVVRLLSPNASVKVAVAIVGASAAITALLTGRSSHVFLPELNPVSRIAVLITVAAAGGAAIIGLREAIGNFFKYLDTGIATAAIGGSISKLEALQEKVDAIGSKIQSAGQEAMSADERRQFAEQVGQRIMNEASEELLSNLERRAVRSFGERMRDRTIRLQFARTIERLSGELVALQRRGTTNLFFGIMITIAGIVMLVTFLFITPTTNSTPWEFFAHYAPRLTLVILVEVFAYFFLRLYKSNLDDIKYFQNEITNVEAKHVALQAVFFSEDKNLLMDVVTSLSKTERNHVLEKGQTTVELERTRIDHEQTRAIAKETASIVASALGFTQKRDEKPSGSK